MARPHPIIYYLYQIIKYSLHNFLPFMKFTNSLASETAVAMPGEYQWREKMLTSNISISLTGFESFIIVSYMITDHVSLVRFVNFSEGNQDG